MPAEPRVSDDEFVLYWKRACEQGLGIAWVARQCRIKPNSARIRAIRLRRDLPELPRMGPQGGSGRRSAASIRRLREILKGEIE